MKVSINVTEKDIARGKIGGRRTCPIALAIKRHIKEGIIVNVGNRLLYLQTAPFTTAAFVADMPWQGRNFIDAFDRGIQVAPITLELEFTEAEAKAVLVPAEGK